MDKKVLYHWWQVENKLPKSSLVKLAKLKKLNAYKFYFFNLVFEIREIIELKKVVYFSNLEKNPHHVFTEMAIAGFIHQGPML
jgi:hypothetical protein